MKWIAGLGVLICFDLKGNLTYSTVWNTCGETSDINWLKKSPIYAQNFLTIFFNERLRYLFGSSKHNYINVFTKAINWCQICFILEKISS